ncbi:HEAT repeat domain-containing protein, partial [Nocardia sp. NPDC004582]
DRDPLVRAAAFTALARLGGAADAAILTAALSDSAWQIREGAARGLAGVGPEHAVPALSTALTDIHPDIRKAAVLTLSVWPESEAARGVLENAHADSDADVRAYARRALAVHAER